MIEVNNIVKKFGGITAVNDISLKAGKGEIFGIVGPDGAGKSTLLRIIASIMKPDNGNVILDGTDIHKNAFTARENIAYMPQRFGLYEELTVEENINFFGRIFGMNGKNIEKRKENLYKFSHLEPFKNRLAGRLSGGMKQKLGLACALIHQPQLIILDEPTNGVDPVSRREFWKILYDLLSGGVSVIISTAYLDEAERCGKICFLYKGNLISEGTPEEIKNSIGKSLIVVITSDPRKSEKLLRERGEFSNIILTGNSLRVFTDNIKKAKESLKSILPEQDINILSMSESDATLEDCFVELLSGDGKIS